VDSAVRSEFAPEPLHPGRRARKPRSSTRWLPWGVAIAAALLLSVAAGIILRLNRQHSRQQSQLQQELRQIEQLQADLNQERAFVAFLRTPEVRATRLLGTPKSPTATGIVFWSPKDTRAYFFASHLSIPPVGKTYQLWMITDKPISAGVFDVNREGGASLLAQALTGTSKAQKFAVTLEPAGGVPQPTGEMHLLGSL
jgi:hypothetical protein